MNNYTEIVENNIERIVKENRTWTEGDFFASLKDYCQEKFTSSELTEVDRMVAKMNFNGDIWELTEVIADFFSKKIAPPSPETVAHLVIYIFYKENLKLL